MHTTDKLKMHLMCDVQTVALLLQKGATLKLSVKKSS